MKQMVDFEKLKRHIEMTVTAEGLRIELSESATGTFFDSGSAEYRREPDARYSGPGVGQSP